MTGSGVPTLNGKLAIDQSYISFDHKTRGEDTQKDRIWLKFGNDLGTHTCAICGEAIARGNTAERMGAQQGQWHHLVKRRYFPSTRSTSQGKYSLSARKSEHHPSNGVLVCPACHGTIEDYENGRPHIMSWLCKSVTGHEIPLVLPSGSRVRERQYRDWLLIQRDIERASDYKCKACGHKQRERVTKQVYDGDEELFDYVGRDVRVFHVLPPVVAPDLMHDPMNSVLLCWACVFGADERHSGDDPANWSGWKDEPPIAWARTFAPHLLHGRREEVDG